MNKLKPEDLYLLIDEPIYVLNDHLHPQEEVVEEENKVEESKVEEPKVEIGNPASTKDIIIVIENSFSPEDKIFLFKGLNALNIDEKDVLIHNTNTSGPIKPPLQHSKQIVFKENPDELKLYKALDAAGIAHLECHPLPKISNDTGLKKQFWLGLKSLFKK